MEAREGEPCKPEPVGKGPEERWPSKELLRARGKGGLSLLSEW